MSELADFLLAAITTYGTPLFGLVLLLGAAGAPIPTSLLVIAAGAFSNQGILHPAAAFFFGVAGVVLGDSLSYSAGRLGGDWLAHRYAGKTIWQRAVEAFQQYGGWAIFFTRFLVTAIATPTNLVAGVSRYRYRRFLALSVGGQAIWVGAYGSLGYAFGSQWELVSDFVSDFSGLALGVLLLSTGVFLYWRRARSKRLLQMTNLPSR